MKFHLHSEQFDGHLHAMCGKSETNVLLDYEFEATDPDKRCFFCNNYWFPEGQPEWHLNHAKELLKARK